MPGCVWRGLLMGMKRWLPSSARTSASHSRSSTRSEEHTSELQSQSNLVCRLLLEKKKNDGLHTTTQRAAARQEYPNSPKAGCVYSQGNLPLVLNARAIEDI